ncbi:GTPase [Acinetobacter towneri]|uniref:GTPase n=1 Tax=Acinetobacter towneri TaxID=202956 RepID=UPI002DC03778|nr:GTPase [Acinetobacter towneri]MEB6564773.1 GTPase [Acinetobacter towneri]
MNMNTSDLFQVPSELKLEQLSFCQNTVKSIQAWAADLSILQLGDSSQALFNALLEISELKCQETLRFDLIQAIHPTLENVLTSLEKHFFNQALISSDRNDHIIELALLLRSHFSKVYIDIARRSHQQLTQQKFSLFAFNLKKNLQTARILATYYALQQLALLRYQQHMLYSPSLPNQWIIAHQLLDTAIQQHYYLNNINQLQGTQHQLISIAQAYAQLILLEIFNTHQIRPAEIQGLYLCSFDWAKLVQILPKETTLSRYVVDSSKDHPPIYNSHQNNGFNADIYISTQALLDHLNENQGRKGEHFSRNERLFLTPALHFHLHNILTNTAERVHERYEYSAQIKICFGLTVAHFYLSNGKNFNETLVLGDNYQFQNESHFVNAMHTNSSVDISSVKTLDRETKQIYNADVLDISVNGYRIKWTGETPKNLKTGEFILVQENNQSPWRGGVIRWIKQSAEKSLELGLEILTQELFPCAVFVKTDRHTGHYHPALLVQSTDAEDVSTSLILPGIQLLRDKQTVQLRLGEEELKVFLIKPLLITQSFMRFDFELLNDQQQPVLDSFIQKQVNEVKNNDLWEALK